MSPRLNVCGSAEILLDPLLINSTPVSDQESLRLIGIHRYWRREIGGLRILGTRKGVAKTKPVMSLPIPTSLRKEDPCLWMPANAVKQWHRSFPVSVLTRLPCTCCVEGSVDSVL